MIADDGGRRAGERAAASPACTRMTRDDPPVLLVAQRSAEASRGKLWLKVGHLGSFWVISPLRPLLHVAPFARASVLSGVSLDAQKQYTPVDGYPQRLGVRRGRGPGRTVARGGSRLIGRSRAAIVGGSACMRCRRDAMTDLRWRFRRMQPAELNQDPLEREFFSGEPINERLVREAVQNSLDAGLAHAGRGAEPVRVRFSLRGRPLSAAPRRRRSLRGGAGGAPRRWARPRRLVPPASGTSGAAHGPGHGLPRHRGHRYGGARRRLDALRR